MVWGTGLPQKMYKKEVREIRATMHNARTGKNGVFLARHNDRQFNTDKAEHIEASRSKENVYWHWMQEEQPQMTFEEAEFAFYEKYCRNHLDAQNSRYKKQRHIERVKSMDEYRTASQTCPEEVIWAIGNQDDTISPRILKNIIQEQINWEQKTFPGVYVLNVSLHMDEASPHIHERRVFLYTDSQGHKAVGQNKALEQMGIGLPNPDKPRSRYNNRKQTFSKICRDHFLQICKEHGLQIEETPREYSKSGRELEDYKANQAMKKANDFAILSKKLNISINIKQSQIADLEEDYCKIKENLEQLQNMLHTAEQRKMFELFYQHERERTR